MGRGQAGPLSPWKTAVSTAKLPLSSLEGPKCMDSSQFWGQWGPSQGVADREPLRLGMRRKSASGSQMEIVYVSVLQDPSHAGKEGRTLNSSFQRPISWRASYPSLRTRALLKLGIQLPQQ